MQNLKPVSGVRCRPDYFRFLEYNSFHPQAVIDVLRRKVVGVVFRDVIDHDAAAEIVRRFWDSPALKRRGGEVCESLGYYVGAYHYHKPTRQYLDESEEIADCLKTMLDVPNEPSRWFRERLGARLAEEGVTLRLCEQNGKPGCPALIRHWNAPGRFALQPHDDVAQCRWPEQEGFEVQDTINYAVCAVNMCLENGDKGRLIVWNIIPDEESKRRLNLQLSGSPYPPEVLERIESLHLDVNPGDVYVFNGEHVHGVEESPVDSKRTTLAWSIGFCNETTVITWT